MQWRNTVQRWGLAAVAVHWVTAVTVTGLFALGLWMVELNYYSEWYQTAPALHKSIGITLFLLTAFRLAWRWSGSTPVPLQSHAVFEKKAAAAAHALIYLLMFAIFVSGYLISTADGRAISVFGLFEVPATLHGIDGQEDIAGEIHLALASTLIATVAVHAAAAVKHHMFDRDRTLLRMLGR